MQIQVQTPVQMQVRVRAQVLERFYHIDDLWQVVCQNGDDSTMYELIDGELLTLSRPGRQHGFLASEICYFIRLFDSERKLGIVTVEAGYRPPANHDTLLGPDVAFTRHENLPQSDSRKWTPQMPDLAVEIKSPSNSRAELRRKAAIYLRNGSQLVWLVLPERKAVEVCRLGRGDEIEYEFIGENGSLYGETVLPGFRLELTKLFA